MPLCRKHKTTGALCLLYTLSLLSLSMKLVILAQPVQAYLIVDKLYDSCCLILRTPSAHLYITRGLFSFSMLPGRKDVRQFSVLMSLIMLLFSITLNGVGQLTFIASSPFTESNPDLLQHVGHIYGTVLDAVYNLVNFLQVLVLIKRMKSIQEQLTILKHNASSFLSSLSAPSETSTIYTSTGSGELNPKSTTVTPNLLLREYREALESREHMHKDFSMSWSFLIFYWLVSVVFGCQCVIVLQSKGDKGWYIELVVAVITFLFVSSIVEVSDRLNRKKEEIQDIFSKVTLVYLHEKRDQSFSSLFSELKHGLQTRNFSVHIIGEHALDRRFLLNAFGAIITYCVLVIQMDLK